MEDRCNVLVRGLVLPRRKSAAHPKVEQRRNVFEAQPSAGRQQIESFDQQQLAIVGQLVPRHIHAGAVRHLQTLVQMCRVRHRRHDAAHHRRRSEAPGSADRSHADPAACRLNPRIPRVEAFD
jgi:hypothetical protein